MKFETLIETEQLAAHLSDRNLAIVDCRYSLQSETWGKDEYLVRHIPRAAYADLSLDLSGEKSGRNGRHPLPDANVLAARLGRLGVGNDRQVVAYDQEDGSFASRLWWLLRWLGHDRVAVLDGGFAAWVAEGRPVAAGDEAIVPAPFSAAPHRAMAVSVEQVTANIDRLLVDARSPERYRGENEPLDRVPGHIPGAVNHHFKSNLDASGKFRSPDDLRQRFKNTFRGRAPEEVICYCGSGVTACHNLLALEIAGLRGARLYAGSWSEWSSDPSRPVERDATDR